MKFNSLILLIFISVFSYCQIIDGGTIAEISIGPDKKAKDLIRKVINNQKSNGLKKQEYYKYNSYIKFLVTTNRDSILNDRLYKPRQKELMKKKNTFSLIKNDDISMLDILKKGHIFIGERAMEHYYSHDKGYKNIVKANRVAGLKSPLYEFAAMDVQSVDLDETYFVFLGIKYLNPISNAGLGKYRYKILDTININGRSTIELKFRPIGDSIPKHLRGRFWIDEQTLGVLKFNVNEATSKKANEIVAEYELKNGSWFPKKQYFEFNTGKYDYVAETIEENKQGVTVLDTLSKSQPIMVYGNTYFNGFEISYPIDKKVFRGHESEVDSKAYSLTHKEWVKYRQGIHLDDIEQNTYLNLDSLGQKYKVDKFLKYGRASMSGYLSLGFVDWDLMSITNYNEYEGLRIGSGFKTNSLFDDRWKFEGNVAYGFKDHNWKYGLGTSYLINKPYYGIIGIKYFDDVSTFGITHFPMRNAYRDFRNNLDRFQNELFTKEKNATIYYQQDFLKNATFKLIASKNNKTAAFDYAYDNVSEFDFFDIGLGLKWSPKNKFARTDFGKVVLENNYPVFNFNITKSINGLGGDYDYTKLDFRAQNSFENPIGKLHIIMDSGIVFGDTPLMNLYAGNGNNSLKKGVFNNLNIAGVTSFETMGEREFFSDRFMSIQLRQYLPVFKFCKKPIRSNLIYRGIIGDIDSKDKHSINFNTLDQYYQEAGIELDNIFMIFGIGSYYRFGAYHLDNQGENFSVKLTAKINLF